MRQRVARAASRDPGRLARPLPGPGAPVLELEGLERSFGEHVVFRQVNWRLGAGEVGAVMGPNGAGKTTLVQVVAGLLLPSRGAVRVAGHPARPAEPGWRRWVGYVGHRPLAFPELTALENLVFFGRLYGLAVREVEEQARELLDRLGLAGVADRPAGRLSRGLAQRLEVARAMIHRPRLWLWDEPFTGLDAGAAHLLENLLAEHTGAGGTAVIVLHEPRQALDLAGRILFLAGGGAQDVPVSRLDAGTLEAWLARSGTGSWRPGGDLPSPVGAPAVGPGPIRRQSGADPATGGMSPPGAPARTDGAGGSRGRTATPGDGPAGDPTGARTDGPAAGRAGLPTGAVFRALIGHDLRQEWRRREGLANLATFVLLVGLALAFALDPGRHALTPLMGGLVWVAFYFAAVLLFGRGFARDADRGTLDGLLLVPADRSVLYLARVVSQGLQLLGLELLLAPVVLAWLGFHGAPRWDGFLLALGLGTAGLAAVGTLLGALTATVRGREALLPVLLFPLTAPVLLGAVQAAGASLAGTPEQAALWFRVLAAYDTMFLVAGALLFDFVVAR